MIFNYTIFKAMQDIKKTMIKNIANTLFQIDFHTHATAEELMEYYGWDTQFEESERESLIDDSKKKLVAETFILNYFNKRKGDLKKMYANTNDAQRNLNIALQRTAGTSVVEGSGATNPQGNASGEDTNTPGEPREPNTRERDSGDEIQGDGGSSSDREPTVENVPTDDTRGNHEGGSTLEGQREPNW